VSSLDSFFKTGVKFFILVLLVFLLFVPFIFGEYAFQGIYDFVIAYISMFVALGFYMIVVILILMRPVEKSNILKSIHRLKQLERNIAMSTEEKVDVTGYAVHIGKRYVRPPLSIREIESELIDIIRDLSREVKIIFIFDELDKISDTEEEFNNAINYQRKKHVERLLGSLKNLVTTS